MAELREYVTTVEAAELLGVSRARVDQFCRDGRLPAEMVGMMRLIRRGDVMAFKKQPRPEGYPKGLPRKKPARPPKKKSGGTP
jgi:excisionase family DNA binding protein